MLNHFILRAIKINKISKKKNVIMHFMVQIIFFNALTIFRQMFMLISIILKSSHAILYLLYFS